MKYSLFADKYNDDLDTLECEWDEFADWVEGLPPVESKHDAPLFSLCTYGDYIPDGKKLRRNKKNILEVWGIEVDYDGGSIGFDTAVLRAEQAGIEALIYTSPRHKPDEPRWRIVCPFDQARGLDDREAALERINGLFGGSIDSTSFTESQSFFVGPVYKDEDGGDALEHYQLKRVRGVSVALATHLQRIPKGTRARVGGEFTESTERDFIEDVERGVNIHPALRSLSYRWKWSEEKLINLASRSAIRTDNPKRYRRMIDGEIRELVESAREKRIEQLSGEVARIEAPPKPPEKQFVMSTLRDLRGDFPPLEWAIEGIMEANTFGEIYGDSGAGKTFMCIDLAMCLASGIDWHGRKVKQGGVAYINGEGARGLSRRVGAWLQHYQPEGDWNFPFYVSKRPIPLNNDAGKETLFNEVENIHQSGVSVDYIFIDTLSRMFIGQDQNTQTGMQIVAETCDEIKRKYNCTVILVHHTGKADKSTGKGAVDLKGTLDWEFGFHGSKESPIKEFVCTKMKEGAEWDDLLFKLVDRQIPVLENGTVLRPDTPPQVGRVMSSAVLVPFDGEGPGKKAKNKKPLRSELDVQLILEIMRRKGEPCEEDAVRDQYCEERPGKMRTRTNTFRTAWKTAEDSGLIVEDKGLFQPAL